jgi:hypothetical protein
MRWVWLLLIRDGRYFVVGNLAETEAEVVRIAGLLRATESAAQAVSVSSSSRSSYAPFSPSFPSSFPRLSGSLDFLH